MSLCSSKQKQSSRSQKQENEQLQRTVTDMRCFSSYFMKLFALTTDHRTNNGLALVPLCPGRHQVSTKRECLHSSQALLSLLQLLKLSAMKLPSPAKLHISKQGGKPQKNFQKNKKPIRCVKSLTFRNHLGKAAHADLSTKVWML